MFALGIQLITAVKICTRTVSDTFSLTRQTIKSRTPFLPLGREPHHSHTTGACARAFPCPRQRETERERERDSCVWSVARHGRKARSWTRELRARVWIPAWAGKELPKQPRTILLETKDAVGWGGTEVEPSSVALPPSYFYFSRRR